MSKHTPGPWHVQDNTINTSDQTGQLRVDSEIDGAIADCGRGKYVDDESRANARLIAAAPEMVELLRAIYSGGGGIDTWKTKVLALFSRIDGAS
jgi:hypothetical protein